MIMVKKGIFIGMLSLITLGFMTSLPSYAQSGGSKGTQISKKDYKGEKRCRRCRVGSDGKMVCEEVPCK